MSQLTIMCSDPTSHCEHCERANCMPLISGNMIKEHRCTVSYRLAAFLPKAKLWFKARTAAAHTTQLMHEPAAPVTEFASSLIDATSSTCHSDAKVKHERRAATFLNQKEFDVSKVRKPGRCSCWECKRSISPALAPSSIPAFALSPAPRLESASLLTRGRKHLHTTSQKPLSNQECPFESHEISPIAHRHRHKKARSRGGSSGVFYTYSAKWFPTTRVPRRSIQHRSSEPLNLKP